MIISGQCLISPGVVLSIRSLLSPLQIPKRSRARCALCGIATGSSGPIVVNSLPTELPHLHNCLLDLLLERIEEDQMKIN